MIRNVLVSLVLLLAACDTESKKVVTVDDVRIQAEKTLATARTLASQERAAYQEALTKKLQGLAAELSTLKNQAAQKKGKIQRQLNQEVLTLEKKKAEVEDELSAMQGKTGDAWDSAKAGLDKAMADLESAYGDAKSKLK